MVYIIFIWNKAKILFVPKVKFCIILRMCAIAHNDFLFCYIFKYLVFYLQDFIIFIKSEKEYVR